MLRSVGPTARVRPRARRGPAPGTRGRPHARVLVAGAVTLGLVALLAGGALVVTAPGPWSTAAWLLPGVHLVALVVLLARARGADEQPTWRTALAAGLLLAVAVAPPAAASGSPLAGWSAVLAVSLGSLVLILFELLLLRVRLRVAGPYGWFDLVAGLLTSAALTWALLVAPVQEVGGLGTAPAALLLAPAAIALLSCVFVLTSTTLSGGWVDGRVRAVAAGSGLLVAGTWAGPVGTAVDLGADETGAVLATCTAVATVLLALGAALPPPRSVQRRDEDQRAAVLGPVVLTTVCLGVLLAGQTTAVPVVAAWAAALAVVVVLGKVVVLLGTLTAYQRARQEAETDDLTGLGNRRALRELLDRSTTEPFAAVLLDLDGFKAVNDALGHDAGDELLRTVAERLRSTAGPGAHLLRLGGDEFALVLEGARADAAAARARDVLDLLAVPFALEDGDVVVGASAGVSATPEHGPGGGELLRRADAAMYVAKRRRGGVVVHPSDEDLRTPPG